MAALMAAAAAAALTADRHRSWTHLPGRFLPSTLLFASPGPYGWFVEIAFFQLYRGIIEGQSYPVN